MRCANFQGSQDCGHLAFPVIAGLTFPVIAGLTFPVIAGLTRNLSQIHFPSNDPSTVGCTVCAQLTLTI